MNRVFVSLLLLLMCFGAEGARGAWRSFVDQTGRILPGEAMGVANGKLSLKMKDGVMVQIALSQLSQVDQIYLRERFPNAAFLHQGNIALDWKTSIGSESGKIRKTKKGVYKMSESQSVAVNLTNRTNSPIPQLRMGIRVYLADSSGNQEPQPALVNMMAVPVLSPRQTVVLSTPDFAVSDEVSGSTPDLKISQDQRKKVIGVAVVLFENDQPVFQSVTLGLEDLWKKAALGSDGVAVPIQKLFSKGE